MNNYKSIRELAEAIDKSTWRIEQDSTGCHLNSIEIAESLYKSDYRKSNEVAEEIFADIHNTLLTIINTVSEGLDRSLRHEDEDSIKLHAGSLEILKCLLLIFNERKKKYTEVRNDKV